MSRGLRLMKSALMKAMSSSAARGIPLDKGLDLAEAIFLDVADSKADPVQARLLVTDAVREVKKELGL